MKRNGILALLIRVEGGSLSLYIYHRPGNLFTLGSNRVHRFTTYIGVVLLEP